MKRSPRHPKAPKIKIRIESVAQKRGVSIKIQQGRRNLMVRRKRALLISCSVILLCVSIIVGMTYALFTDSLAVENHLYSGTLDVSLTRTYLEYSVLDNEGYLALTKVEDDLDFTHANNENVFGIDSQNVKIAPQSYFYAEMEITNNGNVAFTYDIGFRLSGVSNALAEQLEVTITHPDGTKTTAMLSELASVTIATGEMPANDKNQKQQFSIRVEFIDDVEYNANDKLDPSEHMNNNLAQTQTVEFDLIVTAVQATKRG